MFCKIGTCYCAVLLSKFKRLRGLKSCIIGITTTNHTICSSADKLNTEHKAWPRQSPMTLQSHKRMS